MKNKKLIDWPYVIGLMLIPVILACGYLLVTWLVGLVRYDPAYFTEEYLKKYSVPSTLLDDLETAIRNGDGSLMAQIQGTRSIPDDLEPLPNVRFMIYWSADKKYTDYLFMDMKNYHRYIQHLRIVNGRYVQVPEGAYFLADSGHWKSAFGPLAEMWWLIVILFTLGIWLSRSMAAYREKVFGKPPGVL